MKRKRRVEDTLLIQSLQTYQFKTAERLIFACVSVGVPHTGRKLSIKENDTAVEDFSNVYLCSLLLSFFDFSPNYMHVLTYPCR